MEEEMSEVEVWEFNIEIVDGLGKKIQPSSELVKKFGEGK